MILLPPARIGIIGGGQLGMLTAMEAKKLGYRVTVLDPAIHCPAGQVADRLIVASFSDPDAFTKLSETCDVITYEFEHIDTGILKDLENRGYRVIPSAECLALINDKYRQKQMLDHCAIPVPQFFSLDEADMSECLGILGLPVVFKYRRGGYDGKGNIVARTEAEARKTWESLLGKNAMIEQFIRFERELSIIAAKDLDGNLAFYPPAENHHEEGILRITRSPARVSGGVAQKALETARKVMTMLDAAGLFCIEMFLDADQNIFVNEIAPRPHNSGHHTIDACTTSQYGQLVRILTGMPLGAPDQVSPCVMVNILGNEGVDGGYIIEGMNYALGVKNASFYWYGKTSTAHLRKMGHVTVLDETIEKAECKAVAILGKIVLMQKPMQPCVP